MRVISKESIIYSFNQTTPPICTVENGETFWVETDDCYNGQIKSPQTKRPDIDISIMDCSVGPIAIASAMPGDVLCISINDIQFATQGVMVTSPGLGVLGHRITEPDTKIIPVKNGYAWFSDTIVLPLTPMIGVLGVAPAEGDIHCAIPGNHGSNMDTKLVTTGSKVYLPVSIPGAGLALGDLHACMGDGELSGTGIEIAGRVCLTTTVLKSPSLQRPMIETADSVYTIASAPEMRKAIETAVEDMVHFIMKHKKITFPDAYRLLSATCDIQISQLVNDAVTMRVRAPKRLFAGMEHTLFG